MAPRTPSTNPQLPWRAPTGRAGPTFQRSVPRSAAAVGIGWTVRSAAFVELAEITKMAVNETDQARMRNAVDIKFPCEVPLCDVSRGYRRICPSSIGRGSNFLIPMMVTKLRFGLPRQAPINVKPAKLLWLVRAFKRVEQQGSLDLLRTIKRLHEQLHGVGRSRDGATPTTFKSCVELYGILLGEVAGISGNLKDQLECARAQCQIPTQMECVNRNTHQETSSL